MNKFSLRNIYSLRRKIAREAAILLYTSQEKEYKQAKEKATRDLGIWILPTNKEVAEELDIIAEEHEGLSKHERLIRMRRESLEIMEALKLFHPKLVGSVWRGTAHKYSDIDITVFSPDSNRIIDKLKKKGFKIAKVELASIMKQGEKMDSIHIIINLPSGDEAEIVVRDPEKITRKERCEIYGDAVKGLNLNQLKKTLRENPLQRFVPKKGCAPTR